MNADDEKKLYAKFLEDRWFSTGEFTAFKYALREARARGITEAAGICGEYASIELIAEKCAAAIIAARDA